MVTLALDLRCSPILRGLESVFPGHTEHLVLSGSVALG